MNSVKSLLRLALATLPALLGSACHSTRTVHVDSAPTGARILLDGEDTGLSTPADLTVSTKKKRYIVRLERSGYNPSERTLRLETDVDVIDADEAAMSVLCAPCCCGLPLLNLLTPVDVNRDFRPDPLRFQLDPEGEGLRLRVTPPSAEIYVDGRLQRPLDDELLILSAGDHELVVQSPGFKPYERVVHIPARTYQTLDVELEIAGQGFLVEAVPLGAKLYVDDQYQGIVDESVERVRTEPGPHALRITLEGHETFEDVLTVAAEEFRAVAVELERSGEGIVVPRPNARLRSDEVQIFVDGALHSTEWNEWLRLEPGSHNVEVRVPRHRPWIHAVHVQEGKYLRLDVKLERE